MGKMIRVNHGNECAFIAVDFVVDVDVDVGETTVVIVVGMPSAAVIVVGALPPLALSISMTVC